MNPLRSKRFTYFILLLNALVWSIALDIAFIPISRGELAVLLIGSPLTMISRAANEGALAAMIISIPLFLILWMISIVSYFFLERILKLKKFNLFFLPLIIFSFPFVWATSTYLYGTTREFVTEKMHDKAKVETVQLDNTDGNDPSNWQTYSNDQFGFEIQYPPYMNVKELTGEVKIFGRSGICPVFNDLNNFPVDELRFIFQWHMGKSFSDIWERVYGFPFGEKAYDGTTLIDGNNAYYFYQGAEMPEGRTAYLVYLGQYEAMQIDTYTLAIDSSNCTPPGLIFSDQKTEDQMLSTIKFMDRGKEGTMGMEQYINAQYGYRVKYPSYLTPNDVKDDLTLNFMSFDGPTENDEGSFSIIVNDTTLEKQVELEKWKASHAIMESVKEKKIVKDGYSGVRLDFVPRPDVGKPNSIVVLDNGEYSYSISAETTHIDEILRMFTLFPYPYLGDTQRTVDIEMLRVALEQYRADRRLYPDTLQDLVPSYVVKLPLDPADQAQYLYLVSATKLDYSLSAQLDDGTTLTREAPK